MAKTQTSTTDIITFGCRLNTFESEVIRQHTRKAGLTDAVVFNTCAVTQEAERQSRQAIRRYRREHPEAEIIVTGCSTQINPEGYAAMPEVDRVLGNQEKMLESSYMSHNRPVRVSDIMTVEETAPHMISGFERRTRAFIEIQNGCNHRCTFCTIPYGRGNNRSVPLGQISEQVGKLVEQGSQEIVFTGVDITDYGKDLPGEATLGQMCRRVLMQHPNLKRLRLSSVDVAEIDEDVLKLLEHEPRLMPHLHISLQAGADLVLKRMKRRHLRQDVIEFCKKVRVIRPDATFGADIIVGFPTETEEHFQGTLDIVDACDLTYLHVFPYSIRQGTPAARMPQVERGVIKARAQRLRDKGSEALKRYLRSMVGQTVAVLIEENNSGHCDTFAKVKIQSDDTLPAGTVVQARILGATGKQLEGIIA